MAAMIKKMWQHGRSLMVVTFVALGLLMLVGGPVAAAASEPRTVSVTINAGEIYTIHDVSKNATPGVKVIDNPHALVVHTDAPGKIVLLGAAAGSWDIDVTLANGEKVTYAINVKSIANPGGPLAAGSAPAAMGDPKSASAAPAPSAASAPAAETVASAKPADTGSGPVAGSAAADPAAAPSTSVAAADSEPAAAAPHGKVVLAAATPVSAPPAPPTASAPPAPASAAPDQGAAPSQTASSAAQAPQRRYMTDPLATIPVGSPPLGKKHFIPEAGLDLMVGTSRVIDFPTRIRRVSIADSKIADIQVINPYQLNMVAHSPGFTTLAVWDTQGRYLQRQVRVDATGKQQVLLNVIVAEINRGNTEAFGINATAALPRWNVSLVNMVGGVATPYQGSTSLTSNALISSNPPVTVSQTAQGTLPPGGEMIPLLLSQNLTYGLTAQNNNIQTQSFFQFLETHALARILAEPHLLANSGEKAEFLSGGEIPIVVAQALNTSIVFKKFGTSVIFVPTVVGRDDIELQVKPEVSEPDYAHGVQLFGFTVPAFVTRQVQTFVRLKNNQTLVIAGLLLNQKHEEVRKVPYLGDIPYVRALFRNTSYSNTNTDLVMTVTPQIVSPFKGRAELPTDRGPLTSGEIATRRVYPKDAARPRF